MRRILMILVLLFLPCSGAAYTIYLTNGSEIPGVGAYTESGGEVILFFGSGTMTIQKKDILKIEGEESTGGSLYGGEKTEQTQQGGTSPPVPPQPQIPVHPDANQAKRDALKADLDAVNAEIRTAEEREQKLVAEMNEKTQRRFHYNRIQMIQLEKELEPLKQELAQVQQQKGALFQKRSSIEAELKSLE